MPHVKTQVRNGVKSRLSTLPSLAGRSHNASRQARSFQSNDFPLALVSTSEVASYPAGDETVQRNLVIAITLGVRDDEEDAEDLLDELSVEVEATLKLPSSVGVGKLMLWRYDGSSPISQQPVMDGVMLSQTMTYSCSVLTRRGVADQNLHPN